MPDRDIKFDSAAYPKAAQPCYLKIGEFMASALSQQEAREIFFQIGEQMGYNWTHRTEKKPAPAEPTPQARQDIAATATLHGMGYRWSDTNQWWQPPKEEHGDTVAALRTRITVLTQQAEAQDQALHRNQTGSQKMVTALSAMREALGLPQNLGVGGRVEDGVLEAVQELCQANDMHERVMHCYFNACRTLGLPASTESCKEVMPAIEHLQRQLEERKQLAEVQQLANTEATSLILRIHTALGVEEPFDAEGTGIIPAIRALKARASNGYGIKELGKIREALGIEAPKVGQYPGDCIINAIEALKTRLDTSAVNMHEIADALRLPQGSARISLVLPSVKALRATQDQAQAALREHGHVDAIVKHECLGDAIRDAFGAEAAKLRKAVHNHSEFLTDAEFAQQMMDTLGTCADLLGARAGTVQMFSPKDIPEAIEAIRAVMGMLPEDKSRKCVLTALESLKMKSERTHAELDTNSAWHRGHVVGYTSGKDTERQRCADIAQSAADRLDSAIALRIAQEIKTPEAAQDSPATTAPESDNTQTKHDAYERAAKVADEWHQNHGTVLLLRVAQEIRALKR